MASGAKALLNELSECPSIPANGHPHSQALRPLTSLDKVANLDREAKHLVSNSVFGVHIQIKDDPSVV